MRYQYVYHSSSKQGLKEIKPNISTHGEKWIYATKDPVSSAVFLSRVGGDFTCTIGRDPKSKKVYICERFKGAFDFRYKRKKGSIYYLPRETFVSEQTIWNEEVVSSIKVTVAREEKVDDVKEYLLLLKKQKKLIINYFPKRFHWIPENDIDLVEKAVIWTKTFGEHVLEEFKIYHPHLVERVLLKLK